MKFQTVPAVVNISLRSSSMKSQGKLPTVEGGKSVWGVETLTNKIRCEMGGQCPSLPELLSRPELSRNPQMRTWCN